jgi:peroxiredoxin Q/BCP
LSLEPGKPAPDFTLPTDGGREVSLSGLRGHKAVLYFYPKDDTSGCTREALDFTESAREFSAARAVVIGVSKDPVAKHEKFIAKHSLSVTLASDAEGNVSGHYGTWVEKSMYGRRYMGIERATFLIDAEGILRHVWRKVRVPGHVAAVLAATREI